MAKSFKIEYVIFGEEETTYINEYCCNNAWRFFLNGYVSCEEKVEEVLDSARFTRNTTIVRRYIEL